MIAFLFDYWPYFATLYIIIAAWLGWVNTDDDHGDPRQIRFTWVLSALWLVTLLAGGVLYLAGLAQSLARRRRWLDSTPPELIKCKESNRLQGKIKHMLYGMVSIAIMLCIFAVVLKILGEASEPSICYSCPY